VTATIGTVAPPVIAGLRRASTSVTSTGAGAVQRRRERIAGLRARPGGRRWDIDGPGDLRPHARRAAAHAVGVLQPGGSATGDDGSQRHITVVLNWFDEVRQRVPRP